MNGENRRGFVRFPAHVTSDIARDRWRSIRSKRTRDIDRDGVVVTGVIEVVDKERKEGGDERDRMECSRNPGWAGWLAGWMVDGADGRDECRSTGLGGDLGREDEDAAESRVREREERRAEEHRGDAAWAE